ncbi:MAG: type II toxin-antitoxin system HicB family antitoxin [Chloroflexia bacterium]
MAGFTLPVVVGKDEDGYFAFRPSLKGCYTQGDTYEEAIENIEEAIQLYIESLFAHRESVPTSGMVSLKNT